MTANNLTYVFSFYNNKYFLNNNKKIFKLLGFKFIKKIEQNLENKKLNKIKKIISLQKFIKKIYCLLILNHN